MIDKLWLSALLRWWLLSSRISNHLFLPRTDLELIDLLLFAILERYSLFIYITMSPIIIKHHFFSMWYTNVCQSEHFGPLQKWARKWGEDRESIVYHHSVQLASNSAAKQKINILLISIEQIHVFVYFECDSQSMFLSSFSAKSICGWICTNFIPCPAQRNSHCERNQLLCFVDDSFP